MLTRRLVTTGLAAAVTAIPAVGLCAGPETAQSMPDPILAAIAAHKTAVKKSNRLWDKLDQAEHRPQEKYGKRPWELIAWRNYSAIGGGEIDERYQWFLQGHLWQGADPEQIEREHQDAKRRQREAIQAGKDWDKQAGIAPLRRELEEVRRAEKAASMLMAKTKPTTTAGAAAIVNYARLDLEDGEGPEWPLVALKTAASALASGSPA